MSSVLPQRVLIVTIGTRGDVQPYLQLARTLIHRGHIVGIATHKPFEHFIKNTVPGECFSLCIYVCPKSYL